ncbi:hypothetical protein CE206_29660 (plasmid) [Achromobacter xylosoxidans]|uniref:tyrosine-type recombinase/integrase n=1 Tax=Alcaligenes xylosoxydans xylosoxydans TaxID=85698 RepID=UPI000DD1811D|nr:site-specific integrase [Achromobacter xylosoxidans]AXA80728.1 hypothetical protein CE206_29660 [Achromobacter xylosoxidans]
MNEITRLDDSDRTPHALGTVAGDWEAADVWLQVLKETGVSPNTLLTYTREIRRLRWYVESFSLPLPRQWRFDDVRGYRDFLTDRTGDYVARPGARIGQDGWTPFRGKMAPTSVAQACGIIGELYRFWVKARYVEFDPTLGQARRSSRGAGRRGDPKSLAPELVALVLEALERRERRLAVHHLRYYRDRFLFLLFVRTAIRTTEAALADMVDVFRVEDGADVFWGLEVRHQKGGGSRSVPLDPDVLDAFHLYRRAFNLKDAPEPGEGLGLVLSFRTSMAPGAGGSARGRRYRARWHAVRTRQGVYEIIKGLLKEAAALAEEQGETQAAERLSDASTHWLRHTRAKEVVYKTKNLRAAAELLGHKDLRTTMAYSRAHFVELARELRESDSPSTSVSKSV